MPPRAPSVGPSSNPNFRRLSDGVISSPQVPESSLSFPNPNVQGNPYIYLAVYSSVPVYEMMVRGIGVMRRRSDSYLNATQILKVAGVDKGKRTKILEKDIAMGVHEKVQGGYGRYQGTWIPFDRAIELAQAYNVSQLLTPLFEYTAPPPASSLVPDGSPSALNTGRYFEASVKNAEGQQTSTVLAREQGRPDLAGSDRKRVRDEVGLDGAKRVKLETNGVNGATANEGNKLIHSTKPLGAHDASIVDDPLRNDRHKAMLKSVFSLDPDGTSPAEVIPSLSTIFPPDLDPDTAIDDNDHTALHWAAALARVAIVHALVDFGADMQRGNHVGETPLIRAVLVTNNSDQDSFPALLEILGPSVRTFDDSNRTVLHHAALVAGVKGRASSARYYMECILEYIARHEKGQFRELVDAQDENGDTALNIAARVGNRALVRILIDVGADKMKPNKLGLRPGDFGVETAELGVSPAEDAIASLRTVPSTAPVLELTEAISSITTIINSLNTQFSSEIAAKTAVLDQTRAQLREATRELAEQRKQITIWREKVGDVEDKAQRIRNLERALEEEDSFDWTGRTEIDGSPANPAAGAGFTYRGLASTLSNLPAGITIEFEADPPAPSNDTDENSLVHLMRLRTWYSRVIGLLKQRIQRLEGGSADQERKLQKIVAGCCGVEPDRIEGMLDGLLAALESDGSSLDMGRVSGFLQRVKDRAA